MPDNLGWFNAKDKKSEQNKGSEFLRQREGRREYWEQHVQRWRGSGLTQKEYCSKEGVSLERLGTWKRRLDRESENLGGNLVAVPSWTVTSALTSRPTLGLVVADRYRVEIPDTFSPSTLEAVLQVLRRL